LPAGRCSQRAAWTWRRGARRADGGRMRRPSLMAG
jgi:hypothetical protein